MDLRQGPVEAAQRVKAWSSQPMRSCKGAGLVWSGHGQAEGWSEISPHHDTGKDGGGGLSSSS